MRWATPGIEVLCTGRPRLAAAAMIQSVSTPPPSPPSAAIRRVTGRSGDDHAAAFRAAAGEETDDAPAQRRHACGPTVRIADHLGAVERRAQHRGMRDLAAQAAADAAVDHRGHRIAAQRIRIAA